MGHQSNSAYLPKLKRALGRSLKFCAPPGQAPNVPSGWTVQLRGASLMGIFGRFALSFGAAAALLSGCGGSQPPISAPGAMPQSRAIATHADHGGSWMAPDAGKSDLLYISDGSQEVDVYSYPRGTKLGLLSGFNGVNFMRVDKAGDIFIPSAGLNEVFEYAHGGTSPIATLNDPYGEAYACSIDPVTGNLAVANTYTISGSVNIAVYKHAIGTPTLYRDASFNLYQFCAYDDHSNLFVEGSSSIGQFEFAELPAGRKQFKKITLDNYGLENGLQWEGTYLAVGGATDSGDTYIYHMKIQGRSGTTTGTTALAESSPTANFFIQGTRIVVAGGAPSSDTRFFPYPAGGAPNKTLMQDISVGGVVSKAPNSR
jgi:hypothetical protein